MPSMIGANDAGFVTARSCDTAGVAFTPRSTMVDSPLTVRRARAGDAADFARLMGQPEVYANLMQLPFPDESLWRTRIEELTAPSRTDLQLVAERAGRVIGSLGLHPAAPLRRRHVAMLGISVEAESQGQGVGKALMQAACSYADDWAQILRIELTVFTENVRALALYQRFGFRIEGTHVGFAMRQGRFADVHSMARLHPQPPVMAWPAA
jgi:L-phenylalanine/L-methionine N-acetyltransferase